ncbi:MULTISPECIES: DUF3237 domain-containing protein [Priestia]|uniref:DUF3237 domain-containing protein n=1 Tax=Priestia TaxID=2800373 RepID=UPI001873BF31|nr:MULTISPECIES: DUF3237 domain-containing protein [Priestia]MBE5099206.1 DUF3237 domain-containing protein [Priestia aryabhattai]MEC1070327.1 DUF3237 domain-containing protein [Priestia megaterium]
MIEPVLKKIATFTINVRTPIVIGYTGLGKKQFIPIKSGTVAGEIKGLILPSGADFQIIRWDGRVDLSARYVIQTEDDELIYIENNGIRQVSEEFKEQAAEGKIVPPEHGFFRTVSAFETGSAKYKWLQDRIFLGAAV